MMGTIAAVGAAVVASAVALLLGLIGLSWVVSRRIGASHPPAGRFIDLPSGRVHYVEVGRGPPVVLVHGLGGSLGNYGHSLLAELDGDFRLLAIDRSGSGHTPRRSDADARLPRQAALVAEFIAALRLDRPFLVGHSLGGAIALATALDHPEAIAGLALLAPLTAPQVEVPAVFERLALARPLWRWLFAWTVAVPLSLWRRQATLRSIFAPNAPPADFGRAGGGWLSSRPKAIYAASSDLVALPADLQAQAARYGELTMPVGILYGTEDRILDHRRHGVAMLDQVPQLHLELIEGLGHMVPVSEPRRCADFIRRMAAQAFAGG